MAAVLGYSSIIPYIDFHIDDATKVRYSVGILRTDIVTSQVPFI